MDLLKLLRLLLAGDGPGSSFAHTSRIQKHIIAASDVIFSGVRVCCCDETPPEQLTRTDATGILSRIETETEMEVVAAVTN